MSSPHAHAASTSNCGPRSPHHLTGRHRRRPVVADSGRRRCGWLRAPAVCTAAPAGRSHLGLPAPAAGTLRSCRRRRDSRDRAAPRARHDACRRPHAVGVRPFPPVRLARTVSPVTADARPALERVARGRVRHRRDGRRTRARTRDSRNLRRGRAGPLRRACRCSRQCGRILCGLRGFHAYSCGSRVRGDGSGYACAILRFRCRP